MAFDVKKYKQVPKISSTIVFIAFFLPFFLIKCNGQTLASIPGTKLIVGTEVQGQGNSSDSEVIKPKIFASVGFLAAIAAVVFSFVKMRKKHLLLIIAAAIGVISLLVINMNMSMALGDTKQVGITIEMGLGYYLAFLGFLVTGAFSIMAMKDEKLQPLSVGDGSLDVLEEE